MNLDVMILLGLNCNFKCSHCINESRPGFRDFDLSEQELLTLAEEIGNRQDVKEVGFSGGEPLLYLKQIGSLIAKVKSKRTNVRFSITTNGSLIKKFSDMIAELGIDGALISVDKSHLEFQSLEALEQNLIAAKQVFESVELTTTFENSASETNLFGVAMKHDLKVRFNQTIKGGRQQHSFAKGNSSYTEISCPSLSLKSDTIKITYFPKVGFTACCGPLLFDHLDKVREIAYPSIQSLLDSDHFKLLVAIGKNRFKCNSKSSCENCESLFTNSLFRKYSQFLLPETTWKNIISYSETNDDELAKADAFFKVTRIAIGSDQSFNAEFSGRHTEGLEQIESSKISPQEIAEFADFTVSSFYGKHGERFSKSDIEIFKSQIPMFFDLNYRAIVHKSGGKIVAFMIIGRLAEHPFTGKDAWHVGYWGMSDGISPSNRSAIKASWQKCLKTATKEAPVIAVVDQFNRPAVRLAETFGMDLSNVRMEGRRI